MSTPQSFDTLIEVDELVSLIAADAVTLIDCRSDLMNPQWGAAAFAEAHIPGARFADLNADLSSPDPQRRAVEGRHPLPEPSRFAAALANWGVEPTTQVVVYDQQQGMYAARLWWLLRASGHRAVAVLNGGLAAWTAKELPLASGEAVGSTAPLAACRLDQQPHLDTTQLQQVLAQGSVLVVDARGAARFEGREEPIDPVAGHIPGAINRPYTENLQADGRFKSAAQLRQEWTSVLAALPGAQVVHSCGSGVTACHNLLAFTHAGLGQSALYAPSWSGWITDPARGVATGKSTVAATRATSGS
jgi:thiosulfate/3-mercaptopyruvate sulfurtransferase